ncbi:hypothetical protein BO70DRAFT_363552 [Aspergillus heteromorphus CBS 117.55]|uniref:Tudor domain-containing protein n=1 Tax=Aspergillus heteromorphus CBS 117.55 TaxID=1448321 RepID=A0A317VVT0_9EURO|nr:uncharacterized protein BO70DRAFT_363552 [Aspergillus heteromorphus CBS 117.55]PWY76998.1 hypothetical protein BO70DRAFT_363552 [Aspergillus heteromorphus CBS 117.55]
MSEIAALEAEVKEFKLQLETVQSSLQVDPDNTELQSLKTELEELINLTETSIAELKPSAPEPQQPQPTAAKDRSTRDNDSYNNSNSYTSQTPTPTTYRKSAVEQPDEPAIQTSFAVNEHVLARWVSGDNSFYPARITSITGSATNPVYLVSFKSYGTVENLTSKDIRPISANESRKRKADASSGNSSSQSPAPQPPHASVISAAADINPALATQARKEPSKVSDGPARPSKVPRKVKANKELEAGKMKWKDFASKGKLGRKDSMFRTGDGPNARVGFTGSGQTMRKDPSRTRHVYQQGEEEGY